MSLPALKPMDLASLKPYEGPLSKVTLGEPTADHVTIFIDSLCIQLYQSTKSLYYIELERCLTSAQILDWIMQLASKTWMSPPLLGLTVLALNITLRPQAHLCSFGCDRTLGQDSIKAIIANGLREVIGCHDEKGRLAELGLNWE